MNESIVINEPDAKQIKAIIAAAKTMVRNSKNTSSSENLSAKVSTIKVENKDITEVKMDNGMKVYLLNGKSMLKTQKWIYYFPGYYTLRVINKDPLYKKWDNAVQRCENPKCPAYPYYGGRGIRMCKEWRNSSLAFILASVFFMNYSDGLYLDRIDFDGNYEPSNCRMATTEISANNTRRNLFVEIADERKTLKMWSKELDIPYRKLTNAYKIEPELAKKIIVDKIAGKDLIWCNNSDFKE